MITIKTNHGDIKIELFDEKAPISCKNFRQYATDGHFNDTVFGREHVQQADAGSDQERSRQWRVEHARNAGDGPNGRS